MTPNEWQTRAARRRTDIWLARGCWVLCVTFALTGLWLLIWLPVVGVVSLAFAYGFYRLAILEEEDAEDCAHDPAPASAELRNENWRRLEHEADDRRKGHHEPGWKVEK